MFSIDSRLALRELRAEDSLELFLLTNLNRAHLRKWLPWLDAVTSEANTRSFIDSTIAQRKAGLGPTFAILDAGAIAGVVGFHPLRSPHGVGEIGYWLDEAHQGRGIMTACCRFVIRYGFDRLGLNRIEIPAATENRRSRAIPERLGFKFEGILRQRENLYGKFVDHAMYSLLRGELGS